MVISTLERPELLGRCLAALAGGSRRPAEVIVVDQGVPGGADDVVASARAAGLTVHLVAQERRGLAASQNLDVRMATSPVVAVVDDDCVPDEHWIEIVERTFSSDDPPALVTGRVLPLPAEGARVRPVSSRTSEVREEFAGRVAPWAIGTGGNFAVRRADYLAVGGNDERLGTGTPGRAGNDMDLFYRLLRGPIRARYEPDLVAQHRRSTVEERRARRSSYGFGVGACVGRWMRDGDRGVWRIMLSWVRLRAGEVHRHRSMEALADEARVLGGTVRGLSYGLRLKESWRPPSS